MSTEMTLAAGWQPKMPLASLLMRLRRFLGWIAIFMATGALLLAAWHVRKDAPYTPDSDLAYNMGLVGALLMLSLFLYPLRKRMGPAPYLGPVRHWFRFHMVAGVLGPLFVLFHSAFRVHSFNAAIALASMLLVVASGLVGRLLYRRIHRGLYGRRESLRELQESLQEQLALMRASPGLPANVREQIECFARLVVPASQGRWRRAMHFLSLGFRRRAAERRTRRALAGYARCHINAGGIPEDLSGLLLKIGKTLATAQAAAQFATYERLFSYWHTVHIPFLLMLLVTAVIHVVAVHAY